MNNRKSEKCGCIYDKELYGGMHPLYSAEKESSSDFQKRRPTLYGPPLVERNPYQKPQSTIYDPPPRKTLSCFMVSLIVGALIGGIITWLLGYSSHIINQPTVYGPPPVDTTQTLSPLNNE